MSAVDVQPGDAPAPASDVVVQVQNLVKNFPIKGNGLFGRSIAAVQAVSDVSFDLRRGGTLGLVGESGSGKSTVGRCVLQLISPTSGSVKYNGVELTTAGRRTLRRYRRDLQIVFQDPYSSLNPHMRIGDAVAEPLLIQRLVDSRAELVDRVDELLEMVKLRREVARHVALSQVIATAGNAQLVSPLTYLQGSSPGTGGFLDGALDEASLNGVESAARG